MGGKLLNMSIFHGQKQKSVLVLTFQMPGEKSSMAFFFLKEAAVGDLWWLICKD